MKEPRRASLLAFLVPSLIGALFFLCPVPGETTITIPLAIAVDAVRAALAPYQPGLAVGIVIASAAVSLLATVIGAVRGGGSEGAWARLLRPGAFWVGVRLIGAAIAVMAFFSVGPEQVASPGVGQVLLNDLAPLLVALFLISGFLIPLLTDYGLMEFVGVLLSPVLRTLFKVPGRGAVDATASWMGSSTVGTLITIEQYRAGRYSGREAAIIATNFSLCSIGFAYVLTATVGMEEVFFPVYGTAALSAIVAALILCRIPPLSMIADTAIDGEPIAREAAEPRPSFSAAVAAARARAADGPGPLAFVLRGLLTVASIYIGLIPSVFAFGGIGLLIAEFTPVFDVIAAPVVPVLGALGLPDAAAAAPAFVVGFADQFLTVIVGSGVEAEQARFVIAVAAIAQLLYFSELGALLVQSPLPLGPLRLAAIFVLRTAIILPIAVGISHLLY